MSVRVVRVPPTVESFGEYFVITHDLGGGKTESLALTRHALLVATEHAKRALRGSGNDNTVSLSLARRAVNEGDRNCRPDRAGFTPIE